jgi:hypothetical protein
VRGLERCLGCGERGAKRGGSGSRQRAWERRQYSVKSPTTGTAARGLGGLTVRTVDHTLSRFRQMSSLTHVSSY